MKCLCVFAILCSLLPNAVRAEDGFWRDASGKPIPDTESRKSKNDFAGSLLVTPDEDWQSKWNTSPETTPNFRIADVVPVGKKVFILTFFANPKLSQIGEAKVTCDFQIAAPTGKVSFSQKDVTCFSGRIAGSLHNMYLSLPVVAFSGDPGDPAGLWVVEVKLRDAIRNVELPLRTTFQLK